MEKLREGNGMSLTYKVNGIVRSFKSVEDLLDCLKKKATILNEPLIVEPINGDGRDYDHMQEIMELTYQAIPCIKGIQAMAVEIQARGNFVQYDTSDMIFLGIMCKELLDKLMGIAEASEEVYESDWKAQQTRVELERAGV